MKKPTALLPILILLGATTNLGSTNAEDIDSNFKQCGELTDQGKYELAIFYCDKVLEIDSNHFDALLNKAFALFNMGRYNEAIFYYDRILELEPDHIDALHCKGLSLFLLGKYNEAISYYDRVLEIESSNIFALKNKGLALFFLGLYEDAISYYDKVLEIDPNNADALFLKDAALAGGEKTTDREGRVFRFGFLNSARYDDMPPSIQEVLTLTGSLKVFAIVTDNVGVKDANVIAGITVLPMKRYQGNPTLWAGVIPSSGLPDPGNAIPFKVVVRDYNNNVGVYAGWAKVHCAAVEDKPCLI